jgi:two-component system, OmpR family, response regulator
MQQQSIAHSPSFTIVIVEDSNAYRRSLCQVLEANFASVRLIEAGSVEAAMRLYPVPGADLMLVDIHLPDGNGLDLVRALRRRPGNAELCLMTVYDVPEYRLAAHDCGAAHFLAKATSTSADILAMVKTIMAQRAIACVAGADSGGRMAMPRLHERLAIPGGRAGSPPGR